MLFLSNYLKTTIRNISKNKTFTFINVIGLSISMSVGLLMVTFISEVKQYDTFHEKIDRVYRISNVYKYLEEDPEYYASTSILAGKKIEEEVDGLEAVTIIRRGLRPDLTVHDKTIPLTGFYASSGFFDIFSFRMLSGDPTSALDGLNKIILTTSAAEKLFGDGEALGQTVLQGDDSYLVSGIVEDPPFNSHIDFDVIVSFQTIEEKNKDNDYWLSWTNMWMNHVYMLLEEGIQPDDIQPALDRIGEAENAKNEFTKVTMELQAMENITPGPDLYNQMGKTVGTEMTMMLAGLAFIVIISACFNYTNLSIARSLRRAKEVGVRKVIGATSGNVFSQFLIESIVISLLALAFSIGLFLLIKPYFLQMDTSINEMVKLTLTPINFLQFLVLALITGVLAGILPAGVFSRFNPNKVLKGSSSDGIFKGQRLRKVLIVAQFALSLIFILAATLEYRQYRHAMAFDLGYETSNILNIQLQDNDNDQLRAELEKLPEIEDISSSMMVTSVGNYWAETAKYKDPMDSASVYFNGVDADYLPLHKHQLIAGSNFAPALNDTTTVQVIVNEELLKRFKIGTPDEAVGEAITFGDDEATIVGVIGNFHYGTIQSEIEPFLFRYTTDEFYEVNVKLMPGDIFATYDKIEAMWNQFDPVHTFDATFYDESIESTYSEYAMMVRIIGFLAVLAICIAVMGLLGMVMFTTETRLKEISIRKVLGASEGGLIVMLGKGFMWLLLIAALLAIPATYYLFEEVVFSDVVYRAPIGIFDVFGGTILVLTIAALAIGSQTIGASRTNPAKVLRNE